MRDTTPTMRPTPAHAGTAREPGQHGGHPQADPCTRRDSAVSVTIGYLVLAQPKHRRGQSLTWNWYCVIAFALPGSCGQVLVKIHGQPTRR